VPSRLWKQALEILMMDSSQANVTGVQPPLSSARRRAPSRSIRPRSAVTSGRQMFYDGDENSAWSRRFHDLVIGHINDISAGLGANVLSEAQLSLCRRAAAIECELERLDAQLSRNEPVNLDAYGRAASHLRRLFETLGVERKMKLVQSADEYIASLPPDPPLVEEDTAQ
jgi:hypothetical protein